MVHETYTSSEDTSKCTRELLSRALYDIQHEIQSVANTKNILSSDHIFDFAWNVKLPIKNGEALLLLSWYCLLYSPQRYIQCGINRNNIANMYTVAKFCPSSEIYALNEWEGLQSEPNPVRIATKLKRKINHLGYVRFMNGELNNALERLKNSFIGPCLFDLVFIQCDAQNESALVQVLEIMKYVSPGGALIIDCLNKSQNQYMSREIKSTHSHMTYMRSRKGKVGLVLNVALKDKPQSSNDSFIEFGAVQYFLCLLKLNSKICFKSLIEIIRVIMKLSLYPKYFNNLHKRIFN